MYSYVHQRKWIMPAQHSTSVKREIKDFTKKKLRSLRSQADLSSDITRCLRDMNPRIYEVEQNQ